jgi:enoyl-CoA hydratase/carnithine racemase
MLRVLGRLSHSGAYENILVEQRGAVSLITLNRPKALNALCDALLFDLLNQLDKNEKVIFFFLLKIS